MLARAARTFRYLDAERSQGCLSATQAGWDLGLDRYILPLSSQTPFGFIPFGIYTKATSEKTSIALGATAFCSAFSCRSITAKKLITASPVIGTADDRPHVDLQGDAQWNTTEYWMTGLSNAVMALSLLQPRDATAGDKLGKTS